MRLLRCLLPVIMAACGLSTTAIASDCQQVNGLTSVLLRDYINSKRTIPLEEKECNISISGDIRTIWGHVAERAKCIRFRGHDSAQVCAVDKPRDCGPFPANDFDIIFDLYFDYACDRSWGIAWLQFENPWGIERGNRSCLKDPDWEWGSGRCDGLCLKKAYWGYNAVANGCNRFDIEVGRRPLYTVFDSYVQFRSRFDGVLLKYASTFPHITDFYVNAGAFVIDEKARHFGYVGEFGFQNIMDVGFDLKYSFINWRLNGKNRCGVNRPDGSRYQISQATIYYNMNPNLFCFCRRVSLFGAFLWNHDAILSERTHRPDRKKADRENIAWYVGLQIGDVCREGDWAAQILYIAAQAQSVPDFDVYYIGRGNIRCESFTEGTTIANSRGNANFKGWRFELLYGLTNNLSLDAFLEFSVPYTKHIGDGLIIQNDGQAKRPFAQHRYSRFQVEGIYAF